MLNPKKRYNIDVVLSSIGAVLSNIDVILMNIVDILTLALGLSIVSKYLKTI